LFARLASAVFPTAGGMSARRLVLLASPSPPLSSPSGLDLRPLRGTEAVRALSPARREAVDGWKAARPEPAAKPAPPAYGRPAARLMPASGGSAAFLAQLIAQQEADLADAFPARREDGYAAYRRMAGDDLVVVGPAGPVGLLL
jgi:hypothetical protein